MVLSESDRAALLRWIALPTTPPAVVVRCRIVLACAKVASDA